MNINVEYIPLAIVSIVGLITIAVYEIKATFKNLD